MNTAMESPAASWPERLPFNVALMLEGSKETIGDLSKRYYMSTKELEVLCKNEIFNKQVTVYREEIVKHGLTFKIKARAQAEELLSVAWKLIHDEEVSAAVRASLIKDVVSWAGYAPKNEKASGTDGVAPVSIVINLKDTNSKKITQAALEVD